MWHLALHHRGELLCVALKRVTVPLVVVWATRQQVRKVREGGGVVWVARCSHCGPLLLSHNSFQLLQRSAGRLVLGLLLGGACLGHKPEGEERKESMQTWDGTLDRPRANMSTCILNMTRLNFILELAWVSLSPTCVAHTSVCT